MASSIKPARFLAVLLIGGAAFATLSVSTPASADMVQAQSVSVRINDLDASTEAGRSVLLSRIRGAAKTVCGTFDNRDLATGGRVMACRKTAEEGALAQVDRAMALAQNAGRAMPADRQPVIGMR